jgi:hypothetical protein
MVDFNNVVIMYIVIGVVMVFGGALALTDAGPVTYFIETGTGAEIQPASSPFNVIDKQTDIAQTVVNLAVGGIVLVIGLADALLNFLNWPIFTLTQANAPPAAVAIMGVPMTAGFYLSVIGLFWRST